MIAIYPGRARLLAGCFASFCLFADLAWAQEPAPVTTPSEIQAAGSANESLTLTVFGWGSAEPTAAAEQPAAPSATVTQESAAEPERSASQGTVESGAANQSADGQALPVTTTSDSAADTVGVSVAPNAVGSTSSAAAEPAAAEGRVTVEVASSVPAAETQASVTTAADHLPDTLGGESSPSVDSVAVEVIAIRTPQSPEAPVFPAGEPAAIGAAESTNTPVP